MAMVTAMVTALRQINLVGKGSFMGAPRPRSLLRRLEEPGAAVRVAIMLAASVGASSSFAGEWEQTAGLTVGSYFSDNICLSDLDKKSETVYTVTPRVGVTGSGGRVSMNLDAALEYNSLGESDVECQFGQGQQLGNRLTWVPRARFTGTFDAIDNWLRFEADASASQNAINPFAPGGEESINARGNGNVTYQYGATAIVDRRLPKNLLLNASYGYLEQYNDVGLLGDNTQDLASFFFGMDPGTSRFSLGVAGNYQQINFADSPQGPAFENELALMELRATLRLTRSLSLDARGGQEDNVFVSNTEEVDGSFWDAGVSWQPNTRVRVSAGTGERFFGSTPRFDMTYRHKRSELVASYGISVTFPQNVRVDDGDLLGDALTPPQAPGAPVGSLGTPTFIGQGAIELEEFRLRHSFTGRRTVLTVALTDSLQTQFSTGAQGRFKSAIVGMSRQLGRKLSSDLQLSWRNNEGDGFGVGFLANDLESWGASLGVSRTLGNRTFLTLRYSYTDQTSEQDFNQFTENRIGFTIRHDFR